MQALYKRKRRLESRRLVASVTTCQAFGDQTEHQPAAATTLPGKIWHGRHSSPSLPCTSEQFAQFCSGAGLLRVAGSTVAASAVYFIAWAMGSSADSWGISPARTSRPGCMKQPAAATADSWINLRRAILLNGISSRCAINKSARIVEHKPERGQNQRATDL